MFSQNVRVMTIMTNVFVCIIFSYCNAFCSRKRCRLPVWRFSSAAGGWPGVHQEAGQRDENEAGPEGKLTAVAQRPVDPSPVIEGGRHQKVHRRQGNCGHPHRSDVLHPPDQNQGKQHENSAPRPQSVCPQQVLQTMNLLQTVVGGMCTKRLANGNFILRLACTCI